MFQIATAMCLVSMVATHHASTLPSRTPSRPGESRMFSPASDLPLDFSSPRPLFLLLLPHAPQRNRRWPRKFYWAPWRPIKCVVNVVFIQALLCWCRLDQLVTLAALRVFFLLCLAVFLVCLGVCTFTPAQPYLFPYESFISVRFAGSFSNHHRCFIT